MQQISQQRCFARLSPTNDQKGRAMSSIPDQTFGVIRNEVTEAWYAKRSLEQQRIGVL
jgi:hypothetical protein